MVERMADQDPTIIDDFRMVKQEYFDIDALYALCNHQAVATDVKKKLKAYRKKAVNGNQVQVVYEYGETLKSLQKGRVYPQKAIGLQSFPKEIRAALAQKYYWDIDMVNSQPSLLVQLCKKNGWPCERLEEYTLNRSHKLNDVMRELNCDRDTAKDLLISILFGGKAGLKMSEYFYELTTELQIIAHMVYQSHRDFAKVADNQFKKDPTKNVKASCLAHYLQVEESIIMRSIDAFLKSKNRYLAVNIHDGGFVTKEKDETYFPTEILREIEEHIQNVFHITVQLEQKPIAHTYDFQNESKLIPTNIVINDTYAAKKFVELCGDSIRRVGTDLFILDSDGRWCKDTFNIRSKVLSFEKQLIFKQESALGIKTFDYGGNNRNINALMENISYIAQEGDLPIQLAYEFTENKSVEKDAILSYFNDLLNIASGNMIPIKDYILKYFAHLLQKPLELPGVCLILSGEKGCGKDTLGDFMIQHIIGSLYSHNYNKSSQFVEKHDCERMNRLLIKVEEADRKIFLEHSSDLKSMITGKTQQFNPKGQNTITTKNYARMIFTTNKGCPVDFGEGERRFVLSACSDEKRGDSEYWSGLYKTIFNDQAGRVIADYLLSINLDGFNVRSLPENEYQEFIAESERSTEDLFVEQLVTEDWVSMKELYDDYVAYCVTQRLSYCENSASLGKRLINHVRSKKLLAKRGKVGMLYKRS